MRITRWGGAAALGLAVGLALGSPAAAQDGHFPAGGWQVRDIGLGETDWRAGAAAASSISSSTVELTKPGGDVGTSAETPDVGLEVAAGDTISVDYKLTDGALPDAGAVRLFWYDAPESDTLGVAPTAAAIADATSGTLSITVGADATVEARRARDRDWLARRRQLADPVPGGRAARRIAQLEEAGAKRGAIAAVSQVPLGVLRKVASGEWTHLERDHEARLLAATVEQCRAAASTRLGSRGRSAMADHDRVPAGPTWQILHDLEARGFGGTWVARELGYARGLQLRRDVVSRRIAEQIAELAGRVGDLSYPRTRRNQKSPPPLADLLAAERQEVAAR